MKIVIDIPKETYESIVINQYCGSKSNLENIIINGKTLPEHHGRLIDADALVESCVYFETIAELEEAPTIIEGAIQSE